MQKKVEDTACFHVSISSKLQKQKENQDMYMTKAPTKLFRAGNCFQCMKYCTVVDTRITSIIYYLYLAPFTVEQR